MDDEEKRQLSNINFMVFPGTVLLKKDVSASMEENEKGMDNDLGSVDNVATKSGNLLCTSTDIIIKKEHALLSDHGTRTSDEKDGSCIKILEEDKWNLAEHEVRNLVTFLEKIYRLPNDSDLSPNFLLDWSFRGLMGPYNSWLTEKAKGKHVSYDEINSPSLFKGQSMGNQLQVKDQKGKFTKYLVGASGRDDPFPGMGRMLPCLCKRLSLERHLLRSWDR
ncbi:hypothetical protein QJS04_geneDACA009109 [Acorus gramineus]|uniref:Uncharacterized protein n=1 Tax=Acorus gramineus TaxID=55184 RepID=A0AAV9ARB2_ACOGR|nr:hypothetical protein QJS04_geneDACA009109 [Acorus gramineus]